MTDFAISSFSETNSGERIEFGNQVVRYDRLRTAEGYGTVSVGGATQCKCAYCRNFIAQRDTIFPTGFVKLLDKLGIDPAKEGEVYEIGPSNEGRRLYGGWFFFVGQMIEAGEGQSETDGVTYQVSDGRKFPRPDGDFGLDLLALTFTLGVPWVLEEGA